MTALFVATFCVLTFFVAPYMAQRRRGRDTWSEWAGALDALNQPTQRTRVAREDPSPRPRKERVT